MKNKIFSLLFILAAATSRAGAAELKLFNGKDLKGWTDVSAAPAKKTPRVWSAEGGTLRCLGMPMGYLRTDRSFKNFVLTLEWRYPAGKPAGNSGVMLRLQAPDKVWPASVEVQLHSGDAGDLWGVETFPLHGDPARTAGRRVKKFAASNEKPAGSWNRCEVRAEGGTLTVTVNGLLQNRAEDRAVLSGPIALQAEGSEIEFRNIRLKELK